MADHDVTDSKKIDPGESVVETSHSNPGEKPQIMPTTRNAEEYNMGHRKRGLALIFHHTKFNSTLGICERKGSDTDKDKLTETMIHLGFSEEDVVVHEDLTLTQIKDELKRVAELDHTDHDCLIVSICTRGSSKDKLCASDGFFLCEELWEPFVGHKCKTLIGKPKIFFIQAWKDEKVGYSVGKDSSDGVDTATDHYKIPSYADLLVYYSTMPVYLSRGSPTDGSWFVQSLCKLLMVKGYSNDFLTLLTMISHEIAYKNTPDATNKYGKMQIPCITSMLTRKMVFTPKKK